MANDAEGRGAGGEGRRLRGFPRGRWNVKARAALRVAAKPARVHRPARTARLEPAAAPGEAVVQAPRLDRLAAGLGDVDELERVGRVRRRDRRGGHSLGALWLACLCANSSTKGSPEAQAETLYAGKNSRSLRRHERRHRGN